MQYIQIEYVVGSTLVYDFEYSYRNSDLFLQKNNVANNGMMI